jgi:enoyl-[acyl-carrier protein] reductase II
MKTQLFNRFFKRGCEFLGVKYPFICGAMTWVSDPKLVATVCNAGGFACLAGGNTPPEILQQQVEETRRLTDKPFGMNLITIAPAYREQIQMVQRMNLPFVFFAGSFPREREIKLVQESGTKVLCFASELSIARRMVGFGADALILEGMEAGGHVGHVSLIVLLQQLLFEITEVPVFVAGGIATGRMCAHLFLMGAAGIQLGTRFAVAEESCAHPDFKQRLLRAKAREAVSTPQFDSRLPVVAVRALRNKGHDDFAQLQFKLVGELEEGAIQRNDAQERVEEFWMGALRRAVLEGDVSHGSVMAGQSVGLVEKIMPVRDILGELVRDTEAELQRVRDALGES